VKTKFVEFPRLSAAASADRARLLAMNGSHVMDANKAPLTSTMITPPDDVIDDGSKSPTGGDYGSVFIT